MYCKKFLKVNSGKYWYGRLDNGSNYVIVPSIIGRTRLDINYGVTSKTKIGGKLENFNIGKNISQNGLYGAYTPYGNLGETKLLAGIDESSSVVLPFLAYYGNSRSANGGKDESYYCRATIDENSHDYPIEVHEGDGENNSQPLGVYDNCYVGIGTQWGDCGDGESGTHKCATDWNYVYRGDGGKATSESNDDWRSCGYSYKYWGNRGICYPELSFRYDCKRYKCAWEENASECNGYDAKDIIKWPLDFCDNDVPFDEDAEPDVNCKVIEQTDKSFYGYTADTAADGDEVSCFFDCFNYINKYDVAKGVKEAKDGVSNLFVDTDSCWEWTVAGYIKDKCADSFDYTYNKTTGRPNMPNFNQCNNNVRPAATTNADFCYVRPTTGKLWSSKDLEKNGRYEIHKKGWVPLMFTSDVDDEQLPLKKFTVNLGFDSAKLSYNVNMFDRTQENEPHIVYYFYSYDELTKYGVCETNVINPKCVLRPTVVVEDNWAYTSTSRPIDKEIWIYQN